MSLTWNYILAIKPTGPVIAMKVRRDTTGPGMKSLTCYQVNRTRVAVKIVRRNTAGHVTFKWDDSHPINPTGSEQQ